MSEDNKSNKNEKSLPIPNYFDTQDGQTPSNTPSNKIKGTLSYDINNFDFTSKFDNINSKIAHLENESPEEMFQNHKQFCDKTYVGRGKIGTYVNSGEALCCKNIICNKCYSKVNKICDSKWANEKHESFDFTTKQSMKENLVHDSKYDFYFCNCRMVSVNELFKTTEELGLDWECDGHKCHN